MAKKNLDGGGNPDEDLNDFFKGLGVETSINSDNVKALLESDKYKSEVRSRLIPQEVLSVDGVEFLIQQEFSLDEDEQKGLEDLEFSEALGSGGEVDIIKSFSVMMWGNLVNDSSFDTEKNKKISDDIKKFSNNLDPNGDLGDRLMNVSRLFEGTLYKIYDTNGKYHVVFRMDSGDGSKYLDVFEAFAAKEDCKLIMMDVALSGGQYFDFSHFEKSGYKVSERAVNPNRAHVGKHKIFRVIKKLK